MASIKDYARMCRAHDEMCNNEKCPLSSRANGYSVLCGDFVRKHPDKAEAIIDQWCAEHPQKTYLQDFLEKFPKAPKKENGEPRACRIEIYGGKCPPIPCSACWNEAMPEDNDGEGETQA